MMCDDVDSTLALLSSDLPLYPRPGIDSDEEEVFFGPVKTKKELFGKNAAVARRRETLKLGQVPMKPPRSSQVIHEEEDEDQDKENKHDQMNNCKNKNNFDLTPKKEIEKQTSEHGQISNEKIAPSPKSQKSTPRSSVSSTGCDPALVSTSKSTASTSSSGSGSVMTPNSSASAKRSVAGSDQDNASGSDQGSVASSGDGSVAGSGKCNVATPKSSGSAISSVKASGGTPKSDKRFPKLPEFRVLSGDYDDVDDSRSSIVDVDNDQIFDSSIFTEYNEADLSQISERISHKWRSRLNKECHNKKSKKNSAKPKTSTIKTVDDTFFLLNDDVLEDKNFVQEFPEVSMSKENDENGVEKVKRNLHFDSQETSGVSNEHFEAEVNPIEQQEVAQEEVGFEDEQCQADQSRISDVSRGRSSLTSTCSDWFNTTREEMILYEKYGEDYDLVVEKMSREEKLKLKDEISKSVPKDVRELLGAEVFNEDGFDENEDFLENIDEETEDSRHLSHESRTSVTRIEETPNVSQLSEKIVESARNKSDDIQMQLLKRPPIPLPRTLTPQKSKEERPELDEPTSSAEKTDSSTEKIDIRTESIESTSLKVKSTEQFLTPFKESKKIRLPNSSAKKAKPAKSSDSSEESYLTPAKGDMSKRKFFKSPAITKSPSYLRPTSASQQRASPRKNTPSSPSSTPQYQFCSRGNCCSSSPFMQAWQPSAAGCKNRHNPPTPIDMAKIVSPVAQYIHATNVPKMMRNIKAKASKDLDDEILAIQVNDDDICEVKQNAAPKRRYFKPLPEAEYRSSRVAIEKEMPTEAIKEISRKFMTTNSTEAVVVRHLGRERVAQREIENWPSSPDGRERLDNGAVLIRSTAPPRESDIFNETSMEMSIREVKKIQKLTPSISRKYLN